MKQILPPWALSPHDKVMGLKTRLLLFFHGGSIEGTVTSDYCIIQPDNSNLLYSKSLVILYFSLIFSFFVYFIDSPEGIPLLCFKGLSHEMDLAFDDMHGQF